MNKGYIDWIHDLKIKIRSVQLKASIAVNEEMIRLYWDIGKSIVEKKTQFSWGSKIVEQMAKNLKVELPDTNGFSRTNLFAMRKFYLFYQESELVQQAGGQLESKALEGSNEIVHQAGGQIDRNAILCKIPWRHQIAILNKSSTLIEAKQFRSGICIARHE